jgi:ribosomal protein S18 acetylase RimI-like enzyme
MRETVEIRLARPNDAESIAAIHVASWRATYRDTLPDSYLDSLATDQRLPMWEGILSSPSPAVKVWVAVLADSIVGFCSVGPSPDAGDVAELHTIYLQPGSERRGIGGALLRHAEREMEAMGSATVKLWVLEANDSARRFYEAAGWAPDGIERTDDLWGQELREVRYRKELIPDER